MLVYVFHMAVAARLADLGSTRRCWKLKLLFSARYPVTLLPQFETCRSRDWRCNGAQNGQQSHDPILAPLQPTTNDAIRGGRGLTSRLTPGGGRKGIAVYGELSLVKHRHHVLVVKPAKKHVCKSYSESCWFHPGKVVCKSEYHTAYSHGNAYMCGSSS